MAKLKDMLNEVAPVIKLDILQKYFLHIHRFKEVQKTPRAVRGCQEAEMRVTTWALEQIMKSHVPATAADWTLMWTAPSRCTP